MEKIDRQVLVISSHVIRGSVGTRNSVSALEAMGIAAWAMLTVSMTWQPAHGPSHRLNVPANDFALWAKDILTSDWAIGLDSIMTGYFGSAKQVEIAADLIKQLKAKYPDLLFFCDPVMGDENGLYVVDEVAHAIGKHLLPIADIIKPNRSELEWLVGRKLTTNEEIIQAAKSFAKPTVIVTSAFGVKENKTANLLLIDGQLFLIEHERVARPVNGLGDMTAALFLAHRLRGRTPVRALCQATRSVGTLLEHTVNKGVYELMIEYMSEAILNPNLKINLYQLDEHGAAQAMKVPSE